MHARDSAAGSDRAIDRRSVRRLRSLITHFPGSLGSRVSCDSRGMDLLVSLKT
jgi:hypothetical protein